VSHVDIGKTHPGVYKSMSALSVHAAAVAREAGLDAKLIELLKIRISQINGCAYCLRSHTRDASALGETAERLAVLAAWWESQYFTPSEQAALQLAERITLISDYGQLPDRGIEPSEALTDEQISAVTWMTVVMNSWNRVAISSHFPVGETP
jgi:AhpD family alkylhydroperoxidase